MGAHWRVPLWRNYGVVFVLILHIGTIVFLYIAPFNIASILNLLDMYNLPGSFRTLVLAVGGLTSLLMVVWERLVILGPVADFFRSKFNRGRPKLTEEQLISPIWK